MCAWKVVSPSRLASIELFAEFDLDELTTLARLVSIESWRRNELIIAEGSPGDRLFFIVEGAVRVSRTIPGVGDEALAILPAGSYFGEMALFGDQKRSADVYADKRSTLLVIYIDELRALLDEDRALAAKFLWSCSRTLAERVRQANAKVTFLSAAGQFG